MSDTQKQLIRAMVKIQKTPKNKAEKPTATRLDSLILNQSIDNQVKPK